MRKGEKAKIRVQKKFAFGRPGEVDKLRFPPGYSEEEADTARREKLLSKAVIYDCTLIDLIERQDLEANGNYYKQVWTKPSKKEYEHPVNDPDEFVFSLKMW